MISTKLFRKKTQRPGRDSCIDAVGTEPDTMASWDSVIDRVKVATYLATDPPHVLRQQFTVAELRNRFHCRRLQRLR